MRGDPDDNSSKQNRFNGPMCGGTVSNFDIRGMTLHRTQHRYKIQRP